VGFSSPEGGRREAHGGEIALARLHSRDKAPTSRTGAAADYLKRSRRARHNTVTVAPQGARGMKCGLGENELVGSAAVFDSPPPMGRPTGPSTPYRPELQPRCIVCVMFADRHECLVLSDVCRRCVPLRDWNARIGFSPGPSGLALSPAAKWAADFTNPK